MKNLSHDQINVSTLKGEGELKNLELNDEILTDLLELPSWLKLSKATCNRVAVRIPWTKLKSVPIVLSLDEVSFGTFVASLTTSSIMAMVWFGGSIVMQRIDILLLNTFLSLLQYF